MTTSHSPRLIVIGNGMVGHYFLEQLVERGAHERFAITVFGEERHRAYDRVHLSEYFSGRDAEGLALGEADFCARHGIELRLGEHVSTIDRSARTVTTERGDLAYDQLVLATGSYPFVPQIPTVDDGTGHAGLVYRTLDDLDRIRDAAAGVAENAHRRGVVIGGGLRACPPGPCPDAQRHAAQGGRH